LRTPLNAIIGYSEILLEETNSEDEAESERSADLKMINSAGRHLLSLVSDVLDMPKIDSDDIELVIQNTDMRALLDDVLSACGSLITHNGNTLILDVAENIGVVPCDSTRLRQILINLLSNAGKFTSNGKITLRASRLRRIDGDDLMLSVSDTGIGIAPDAIDQLFVDYKQANVSISKGYGGTGLGLALCRKLCQLMDASISVESELGRGSTFTVRFNVNATPLAVAA
jgi:signal transduction histidine kinase